MGLLNQTYFLLPVGKFIIDFNALTSKLVPVLLTRYLNALCEDSYQPDENFLDKLYYLSKAKKRKTLKSIL